MDCNSSTLRLAIKNLGIPLTLKAALNKIFYYNHYYFMSLYIRQALIKCRIRNDIELTRPKQQDWERIIQILPSYTKYERREIIRIYNFLRTGFLDSCFLVKNKKMKLLQFNA